MLFSDLAREHEALKRELGRERKKSEKAMTEKMCVTTSNWGELT